MAVRGLHGSSKNQRVISRICAYADLYSFEADKCHQYYYLTDSFVIRFEFTSPRNSQTILFDLDDKSYTMDLEDFNTSCKLPQWGNVSEPRKSEYKDFIASITMGESR